MSKKKSYVPIYKIKNNLRRLHMHCKQKAKAKARCKIDKALYKCEDETCNVAMYEGQSQKNMVKLTEKWEQYNIIKGVIEANHLEEVIEPSKGFCDWNIYIERLWCSQEDYSMLCPDCHKKLTAEQTKIRVNNGTLKRN